MSVNPLISVIIPVYKVEKYLEKCVKSVTDQTYANLEIILVNDGSPDGCGDLCDKLAADDSRIRVIHKENGGLSSARNAGIDVATGEYLSFIDSDDYITPTMIGNMYRLICESRSDIAVTGRIDKFEDGREIINFKTGESVFTGEEAIRKLLLKDGIDVSACDKLFHKSLFDGIRFPLGETNEDNAVMFKLLQRAERIAHTDTADYYYCHRGNSITTTVSTRALSFLIKHSEDNAATLSQQYPCYKDEIAVYLGAHYMLTYHELSKKRIWSGKLDEYEKALVKKTKAFLKKNYKVLKKYSHIEKNLNKQLRLVKLGLYGITLRAVRMLKGKA